MTVSTNVVQQIRQHARQIVRELDVLKCIFQDTGFTYTECHILFELQQHNVLNLMELSQKLLVDKSNLSRTMKELVAEGLVQVNPLSSDKRQRLFSLTAAGLEAVNNNNQLANEQVKSALQLMDIEERKSIVKGLALYNKALSRSRLQQEFPFRLIKKADNAVVARLIREVMTEFGAVGKGYSINDEEINAMYEAYQGEKSAFWIVEKSGDIVGCGGIGPLKGEETTICELRKMYFYPSARGIGLGKKMVQKCLDKAVELGYQKCYLETTEKMWQANLLYQKMGFQQLCSAIGNTGHGACEAYYVKEL